MIPELKGLDKQQFLADYWQKKALLIPGAIPHFTDALSPDELGGLACEAEVESRLVEGSMNTGYTLQHGPFPEQTLTELPTQDWTLLVQAVDHYCPEAAELLSYFRFIPDWRVDDVMASFAPPGGSVGPHFDRYDVFLVQGMGRRRWQLGQRCDHTTDLMDHPDLHLLSHFEPQIEYVMHPGDILYIPPGVAHWGVSIENSINWSVGFRGPSKLEALSSFCDYLFEASTDGLLPDAMTGQRRHPAEITGEDLAALRSAILKLVDQPEEFALWYGSQATEKKYLDEEEKIELATPTTDNLPAMLHVAADARLAFSNIDKNVYFFCNGNTRRCSDLLRPMIEYLCMHRQIDLKSNPELTASPQARHLLRELIQLGALDDGHE